MNNQTSMLTDSDLDQVVGGFWKELFLKPTNAVATNGVEKDKTVIQTAGDIR
jgi:hypothetical protein